MIYRQAEPADAEQIAFLHADGWRRTYRGVFSDAFLDNEADSDRRNVWKKRLGSSRTDQCVYVAEDGEKIRGFVCVYGNEDAAWGSLVDNLHVAFSHMRQGIGTQLMAHAFAWLHANFPNGAIYLWVMASNLPARRFYEKLGASNAGVVDKPNPVGGGSALNCRYVWPRAVSNEEVR